MQALSVISCVHMYADRCPNATQEEKEEMEKAFKEVRTYTRQRTYASMSVQSVSLCCPRLGWSIAALLYHGSGLQGWIPG